MSKGEAGLFSHTYTHALEEIDAVTDVLCFKKGYAKILGERALELETHGGSGPRGGKARKGED